MSDELGLSIQAKTKGARTSDRSAYIRYVVATPDGQPGKDFESFKKASNFFEKKGYLPKGYADDVRTGRRDSGDIAALMKAVMEKLDSGELVLQTPKSK